MFEKSAGPEQDFLAECIQKIPDVSFVDPGSLKVLGRTHNGVRVAENDAFFQKAGLAQAVRSDSSDKLGDPKDHRPSMSPMKRNSPSGTGATEELARPR